MRILRLSLVLAATLASLTAAASASANTAPVCTSPAVAQPATSGSTTLLTLSCGDADGDVLRYTVVDSPQHGTVSPPATYGPIFYRSDAGYSGSDSFTVRANDGTADSAATATVSVNVTSPVITTVPAPTGCQADVFSTATPYSVRANTSRVIPLTLGCTSAAVTSTQIVVPPTHGTLTGPSISPIYTPDRGYTGPDAIGYEVVNASGSSTLITWHLGVGEGAGSAPQCSAGTVTARNDGPRTITMSCFDDDLEQSVLKVVAQPQHGTLSEVTQAPFSSVANAIVPIFGSSRATVTYTPQPGYVGPDSFTITGDDSRQVSAIASASVNVVAAATNTAPTCLIFGPATMKDQVVRLLVGCADPEGDPVTPATLTPPGHGTLSAWSPAPTPGQYTADYTPAANFVGGDLLTVQGTDSHGAASAPKTATLTVVAPGYLPPTVQNIVCARFLNVTRNTPLSTPGNACLTPDGSNVAVSITAPPVHGSATVAPSGALTYTPQRNYIGPDTLTVHAASGSTTMDYVLLVSVSSGARATILTGPATDSADHAPSFTLDAEPGVTLTCALSNSAASTPTACAGAKAYAGLPAGDHVLTVTATDGVSRTTVDTYAFTITDPPSSGGGGGNSGGGGGGGGGGGASSSSPASTGAAATPGTSSTGGGRNSAPAPNPTVAPTSGPATQPPAAPAGSSRVALAAGLAGAPKRATLLKRGSVSLSFRAPGAGTLRVRWYVSVRRANGHGARQVLVASGSSKATAIGVDVPVTVTPSATGRRLLASASGPGKVRAVATFTPTSGATIVVTRRLTLG